MISLRLPNNIENKLNEIAKHEKTSKSTIIKNALTMYLEKFYNSHTPYELGKDLFGNYGSTKNNLSKDYKTILKDKLRDKHSH